MATIETTSRKLVLKQGSTTLTLDKDGGTAALQRKILFWTKKPVEFPIADIEDIAVKSYNDAASGATIHQSVLHRRSGETFLLTTEEAGDAEATVQELRGFVGL